MRSNVHALLVILLAGPLLAPLGVGTAAAETPEVSFDGLHRVQDSSMALVYATPGLDLSGYEKVGFLEVEVAFKKNWRREHREVRKSDMERIKRDVAETLRSVFVEELESGGYEIVDHTGYDVLVVRPAVIDLDISAPRGGVGTPTRTVVRSAGGATMLIELYDSVSGDILARAIDRRRSGNFGRAFSANRGTNHADARRTIRIWAVALREALDNVHGNLEVVGAGPE